MKKIATEVLSFDAPKAVEKAVALLQNGQVIAAPTDTVYGLMCHYANATAIEHLFRVKERPLSKAIPLLLADQEQLALVVQTPIREDAKRLMERFWPGPLTIILPALPHLPLNLTAGKESVAIRIPADPQLRVLIHRTGPLAATSANLSGRPETHSAKEVLMQLNGRIPLLLDGGSRSRQMASTIVDFSNDSSPRIVRPGPLKVSVKRFLNRFKPV